MTLDEMARNERDPLIALVGTTRAGKSVFTTMLAKHLERKRDGVWLSPKAGRPKMTYTQIEEWWSVLQSGDWLPATPPGTLIELQWDLRMGDKKIPLRMFDYAGENLTDLFSGRKDDAVGAAKEFFNKVRAVFENASVLLVLINLESFIEKDITTALENKSILLSAMSSFLEELKKSGRPCRVCFVFTAYDQYEMVIKSRWGSVKDFLEREIPPLYYEFVDEHSNVRVIPVAAVGETEARVNPHDGKTIRYPKPGFSANGFDPLVKWIAEAVGDSKVELDAKAAEANKDANNAKFIEQIGEEWNSIAGADQPGPINRFLKLARQDLPYPQQTNALELESKRLEYFNKAKDAQSAIASKHREKRADNIRKFFKAALGVIACIIVGVIGVKLIGAVQERYATENCTQCNAAGVLECKACEGRGMQSRICYMCRGSGKRYKILTCNDCDGRKYVMGNCSKCGGEGKVSCSMCQGMGKVYKHRAET